ncbi:MAG: DUF5677 domain-containing protein [bacterium]
MRFLTAEQHQLVVKQLVELGRKLISARRQHSSGFEFTSLMVCFLMHNLSAAEALLRLLNSTTEKWFPATVGYTIVRTMFEIDVTAHYISQQPVERSRRYIKYGRILKKKRMDACLRHCDSRDAQWAEGMKNEWEHHWKEQQNEVNKQYEEVKEAFKKTNSWAGMTIKEMAKAVHHEEAYDIFYAELCSFAHADVKLVDRFLQRESGGLKWSMAADEFDVASVFRYVAIFLSCTIMLFDEQFECGMGGCVDECWNV